MRTEPVCLVLAAVFMLSSTTELKKDEALYCSACMAIAEEINYSVSQTDPKKTIHVGGFRLKLDGSLADKKVTLARSEAYLTELLEEVCNSMSDYALYEDPDTKEKSYKRFAPRGNDGSSSALKFACESIVEELEDDIISLFASEADHVTKTLCSEVSGHCKSSVFQHSKL
uniref:Canopy FGF signaling regulator 1 n=1 Tax=Sinocyclocheilus grahami TaxID=75366 RepID=A0A672MF23_SINGR